MQNSVPPLSFDPARVAGPGRGAMDRLDSIDGFAGLIPHPRPNRISAGAPLAVRGWAVVGEAGAEAVPEAVVIVLDGSRACRAAGGISRRDVAPEAERLPERVGYEAVIATDVLLPGGHELRAYAATPDGAWYEVGYAPFWICAVPLFELPRATGNVTVRIEQVIDMAADGRLLGFDEPVALGRFALLTGWAVDRTSGHRVGGVVAADARGGRWIAPCDVVRADLRGILGAEDDRVGFEIVVPTEALGRGRHRVSVTAFVDDGRLYGRGIDATIDVAGSQRSLPGFVRVRPDRVRGAAALHAATSDDDDAISAVLGEGKTCRVERGATARIDGWALERDGRGAESVVVELAPRGFVVAPHRFPALAGVRAPRSAPKLPEPPAADAWFRTRFGTATLPPGEYAVTAVVVERDRRTCARLELGVLAIADAAPKR